jgi:hypothetical protein
MFQLRTIKNRFDHGKFYLFIEIGSGPFPETVCDTDRIFLLPESERATGFHGG